MARSHMILFPNKATVVDTLLVNRTAGTRWMLVEVIFMKLCGFLTVVTL
jgi:hypothetical protein